VCVCVCVYFMFLKQKSRNILLLVGWQQTSVCHSQQIRRLLNAPSHQGDHVDPRTEDPGTLITMKHVQLTRIQTMSRHTADRHKHRGLTMGPEAPFSPEEPASP